MAAIDKLYARDYWEYDDFLRWVLIYYPKMLVNFYNIHLTYKDFQKRLDEFVKETKEIYDRDYERLGENKTFDQQVDSLRKRYKDVGYNAPTEQLVEEVKMIIERHYYDDLEIESKYRFPIMIPTFKQDKILLWRCPFDFVREYLETHCGYKTKWYHKLFWKGRKLFN